MMSRALAATVGALGLPMPVATNAVADPARVVTDEDRPSVREDRPDSKSPATVTSERRSRIAAEIERGDAALVASGHKTAVRSPANEVSVVAWKVLALPEIALEAILFPVGRLVEVSERKALPARISDLVEITDRISIKPRLKAATGLGLGFGAALEVEADAVRQRDYELAAMVENDRDFEINGHVRQRVAALEGRTVGLEVGFERERGKSYYGIGGDSSLADERELGIDALSIEATSDLAGRGTFEVVGGELRLAFLRQRLYPGTGTGTPVGGLDDTVAAPPGFGETASFVETEIVGRYDRRDTDGRTSKGLLGEIHVGATSDVNGRDLSGINTRATAKLYLPVLSRERSIAMHVGVAAAEPLFAGDEIPLHGLVTLGRSNFLRGYARTRFRATRGWWSGLEYRYPIWFYDDDPTVLTSLWFVDVGKSGDTVGELTGAPRYSYGVGLALERYKSSLASFQFGRSPEGNELIFGAGGAF